jgi:TonB-linked SusC/RagA family outer membrane protein
MKRRITFCFLVLFVSLFHIAWAQDIWVTGKVTDKTNGAPLESVSVLLKGSTTGTKTNLSGEFKIKASEGATLVFSFIGMESLELKVGHKSGPVQVALIQKATQVDEVVVIGYGTQKKSNVTGAIATVKAADLQDMPTARLEDALKGRTSGVTIMASSGQPGTDAAVYIRGLTSINGSAPLFVVDGMPVAGGIDYLNSSDIESIEVLKDAASAAIYGTKAAAGVIMVTTKTGKAGAMQVNYNGYYGSQAPARELNMANATQYATLRNESSLAAGNGIIFSNPASLGQGTNWQDAIFNKNAKIQNHELSLSGGNEKSTFNASFGYFKQEGIVASQISDYERFTVRINSIQKVKSWLTFGENAAYAYTKSQAGFSQNGYFGGPLASAINLDPITPLVETDPNVIANNPTYANNAALLIRNAAGNPYGISQYVGQEMSNPVAYIQTQLGNFGWSDKIVANGFLEIEPIKGLKIKSNIGTDLSTWGNESFTPTYFLSNTVNNTTTNSYNRGMNRANNWVFTNTATYSRKIDKHNFSVLVGYEAQNMSTQFGVNATYFGIPATSFSQASMNYGVATANTQGGGYESQPYTLASTFGRVTYDYDGKYLFTGIVRRDGSSHFGTNNLYATFPSLSLGWNPLKEKFWKTNKVVTALKIRVGYGVNGNDNLAPYQFESTISGAGSYVFGSNSTTAIGYAPTTIANPNLEWEQTKQTNIGLDASLFNDLTISFDYFKKTTTGMLMQVAIPGYVGASSQPYGNVASMYNKGVELQLGYKKKIGQVFLDWSGNVSYIKNEVTNLGATSYITGQNFQASSYEVSRTMVGHPFNSFYGFQELGVFQNQAQINSYVDKNGNLLEPNAKPGDFKFAKLSSAAGPIGTNDRTFLGNSLPTWAFGTTLSAAFKGFDVKVFAQGVAGNKIFQELRRLDIPTANYTTKALGRWTGAGTSNDFPRLVDGDPNGNFSSPSNFYLENGAYFRIKTIQIGYSLPKELLNKVKISRVRIYVSANNLFTFTKYEGFDPEVGGGLLGVDRGIYPQAKSFMGGANITF